MNVKSSDELERHRTVTLKVRNRIKGTDHMVGMLAAAKAGHDKDTLYIIIEETDKYVWLTDGKYRQDTKPKKKNKKHIQIWKKENEALKELRQKLEAKEPVRDEEIKRTIKLIKSSQVEE